MVGLLMVAAASSSDAGLSKSSSPKSELAQSTRTTNDESHSALRTTNRDIPGAFPTEGDRRDICEDVDPSNIPLPPSLPEEQHLATPESSPTTPGHRKRKRDATDLPSQKPLFGRQDAAQTQARSRIGGKSLWRLFNKRYSKAFDELDKENNWAPETAQSGSQKNRRENLVASVIAHRNACNHSPMRGKCDLL